MVFGERFSLERLLVTDLDGGRRVVSGDPAVFDEHAGHPVAGGRHDVGLLEADVGETGRQRRVPVLLTSLFPEAEMPFPEGARGIAFIREHIGQGILAGTDDHPGVTYGYVRVATTPRILSGKQRVAGRGRYRGRGIRLGQADALPGEPVHLGRLHIPGAIAPQVAVPEIIGQDDHHVRRPFRPSGPGAARGQGGWQDGGKDQASVHRLCSIGSSYKACSRCSSAISSSVTVSVPGVPYRLRSCRGSCSRSKSSHSSMSW